MRFLSLYSINYEIPSGRTVDRHFTIKRLVEVSIIALQLSRESYTALPGLTTMDSKEEQPQNADFPIEVTLSGITIDFKEVRPLNASSPIEVTPSGITVDLQPTSSLLVAVSMIPLQLARESYTGLSGLTVIEFNEDNKNANSPIEVTLSGMTMDSKDSQDMNAQSPIEVTPSGITMDRKEEHP